MPQIMPLLPGILKEIGIPDHLTCLLRNLYAGQEATVRTEHGTMDCFQIGKGVRQGCILLPCLFNLYAEWWWWLVVQLLSRVRLLRPLGRQPARVLCPWDSPGKNTGVGCHFLLQGIFPNQELNPGLLHCRKILYQLSYEGSPKQIDSGKLLNNTGNPAWCSVMIQRSGLRDRRQAQEGRDICIIMTNSYCFMAETNTKL